ncbi:MAG: Uma2 family endonuclease [Gemmatimonadales bacterium]
MVATRIWTREEVLALPDDGNRHELIDGELLVTPAPRGRHQQGIGELYLRLAPYVRAHGIGAAVFAPADLDLRSGQLVQPDLFVGAMVDGRAPVEWDEFGIPLLVVEVLSPSTAKDDRVRKRHLYQRVGVPVYWIVDLDARVVEEWTPDASRPRIIEDRLIWQPDTGAPTLEIELKAYFARAWGEV